MSSKSSTRGFASWPDKEKLKQVASQGGKACHTLGVAHEFTTDEAKQAGAKGGRACAAKPGYMSELGKLGGKARAERRAQRKAALTDHPAG